MRKEGYIDNRGNYVRPGPDYQRLLMVALMNALAMLLAERMVSGLQFGSLLSLLLAALLWLVVWLIPGCSVAGFGSAILASIVISLANLLITWIVGRL